MDDRVTQARKSGKLPMLAVVALLVIVALLGAAVWMDWSSDSDSAAEEAAPHPVQPAEIPSPADGAVPAQPRDASAAAMTRDGERG